MSDKIDIGEYDRGIHITVYYHYDINCNSLGLGHSETLCPLFKHIFRY